MKVNNFVIEDCLVGPGITISNVHNAIIKNIQVDYQNSITLTNASGDIYFYDNTATWLNIYNINEANIRVLGNQLETEGVDYNTDWITMQSISNSAISFINNITSSQVFKTYKINTSDTISSIFALPLK
jgi:hypothetical protein